MSSGVPSHPNRSGTLSDPQQLQHTRVCHSISLLEGDPKLFSPSLFPLLYPFPKENQTFTNRILQNCTPKPFEFCSESQPSVTKHFHSHCLLHTLPAPKQPQLCPLSSLILPCQKHQISTWKWCPTSRNKQNRDVYLTWRFPIYSEVSGKPKSQY